MRRLSTMLLIGAVLLPLSVATARRAPSASAQIDRHWQAVQPAGDALRCVPLSNIRETRVRDDRTIDFVMRNGKTYRNVLPNSCPRLGFEQSFSYKTSLSQLCNVDIVTVLERSGPGLTPGPSCGLGDFQPIVPGK